MAEITDVLISAIAKIAHRFYMDGHIDDGNAVVDVKHPTLAGEGE